MASNYIEDGFTVEDEFPKSGWQSAVKFRYRPALAKRVHKYFADLANQPKDRHRINVALIIDLIDSWDAKDSKGQPLDPRKASTWDRISPQLQTFCVNCICGNGPDHADMDMEETAKNSQ